VQRAASLACLTLVALNCCSRQKPISQDGLQSKLRSAASIAAETATFLDYVEQERSTVQYAKGHIEYLSSELTHTVNELQEALPPAGGETQFAKGREQVDALAGALNQLPSQIGRPDQLAGIRDQITAIRKGLQRAISSL
jgi:hypothetical protein